MLHLSSLHNESKGVHILYSLLNDWEIERVANLLSRIGDFIGANVEQESLGWRHNSYEQFTVNRAYRMEGLVQNEGSQNYGETYGSPAPTKVKCFTWLVAKRAWHKES